MNPPTGLSQSVARKAATAAKHGITPLVCIGEKDKGTPEQAVEQCRPQIESLLDAIPSAQPVIFAWEPVWAIGQPEPASAEYISKTSSLLRAFIQENRPRQGEVRIIYGGSAGPGLFAKLGGSVDGLFLGRFAHNIDNLRSCIEEVAV